MTTAGPTEAVAVGILYIDITLRFRKRIIPKSKQDKKLWTLQRAAPVRMCHGFLFVPSAEPL